MLNSRKICRSSAKTLVVVVCLIFSLFASCKFFLRGDVKHRIRNNSDNGLPSLILPDSISLERTPAQTSITLSFETSVAVSCKLSFHPVAEKPTETLPLKDCASMSATKFSELLSGVPKDKLVTIVIKSWASSDKETSATFLEIDETIPAADAQSLNMVAVDLGASRLEFSTLNSSDLPSAFVFSGQGESGCWPSGEKSPGKAAVRKLAILQSLSSQGFISAATSKVSQKTFAGTFQNTQRLSTEWSLTAKTAAGFGRLRLTKPTLLASSEFSGQSKVPGNYDRLEDIDPPGLKLPPSTPLVVSWVLDGDGKNATATLTIEPSGAFTGISCRSPANALKITVPAALIAKMPPNARLWSTLRLDSWQALDKERWVVRVSDWSSMGVQKM